MIDLFRQARKEHESLTLLEANSPIQGVILPGNSTVLAAEKALVAAGFGVRAIRSPTVPSSRERLRICLHSFNTFDHISALLSELDTVVRELLSADVRTVGAE
jgi:8-amino-7-oxononanoate synthase